MKNPFEWFNSHSAAFIAVASAIGMFMHAVVPAFAEASGETTFKLVAALAIVMSVATSYAQGTGAKKDE